MLEKLGINAVYLPLPCHPDQIAQGMQGFRALGFVGANVTIPFKEPMVKLVDELTPIARFMGSVNTLFWRDGKLWGTTTDPYGALKNLAEHGIDTRDRKIALLGNGGAARALAFALLSAPALPECGPPRSVTLFGRNPEKLQELAQQLRAAGLGNSPSLDVDVFENFTVRSKEFDLLINGTSVGMAPGVDEIPVSPDSLHPGLAVYDIVYNPEETRLLREAKLCGCKIIPGIGMLIHQGALSFSHWFPGQEVQVDVMREALERFRARIS